MRFARGAAVAARLLLAGVSFPAFAQTAASIDADEIEAPGDAAGANALLSYPSLFHSVRAERGMVAAQDRLAAEVGRDILAKGGNVVDAAVATGFALAVTHPQAGNLGGGGFMMIKLAGRDDVIALDYREMAPSGATRDMFLNDAGDVDNMRARFSHLSSGVPGSVMGLTTALEKYGTMKLKDVIAPAIRLAEGGYPTSDALADALGEYRERFARDPSSAAYFLKAGGAPYKSGEIFRQKDLAKTLKAIRDRGAAGFYEGPVADLIVDEMQKNGGLITREDLKAYRAVERQAVAGEFRGYQIVSMPPPSSGGVHLIEMLNILEGYDLKKMGHNTADYLGVLVESMRRAYADRSEYLGDPDFIKVPVDRLIDQAYADKLRGEIKIGRATKSEDVKPGLGPLDESPQTTHYSVMDSEGNAVAATTTLNFTFGNSYSVDGAGFLLNNEMDDFSAKAGAPNGFGLLGARANEIEPGKRPLSSMTPTIVLKDGKAVFATGTPGGSTIITIVLQNVLNMIEFGMNPMQANATPKIHHQWQPDRIMTEPGISLDTIKIMEGRGFLFARTPDGALSQRPMGRTNTVMRTQDGLLGAADPREPDGAAAPY
ncbi:MAG: gamma-glutamyltransferase [Alphaproteobacteria bacterium RIFCSPHIGHO2_12_FULL_63_12]|nr:MAG: gamma-glutamyltransferase [Alphaproteobacteria bacterium RIFCSPHIGHO2_12_FULL_63_12]